jgi:flavin reductase (DIM6/NTAB) family NADH-FMN oxidoreductase RutF
MTKIAASDAYKLLASTVVPQPIALATTVDRDRQVNAAPFSFFNAVSSVPPVVVLGISPGASGRRVRGGKAPKRWLRFLALDDPVRPRNRVKAEA